MSMVLDEIYLSLINGQNKQMVEQIDAFGSVVFWNAFVIYLDEIYESPEERYTILAGVVNIYHKVKGE